MIMNEHERKQNDVIAGMVRSAGALLVEVERKHAVERLATRRLLVDLMTILSDARRRTGQHAELVNRIADHLSQMDDGR